MRENKTEREFTLMEKSLKPSVVRRAVLIKYTNFGGRYQLQSQDLYKSMTNSVKTGLLMDVVGLEVFKQQSLSQSYNPRAVDYDWVGLYAGFLATHSPNRKKAALIERYFRDLCGSENEDVVFERVFGWSEEVAWKKFIQWAF